MFTLDHNETTEFLDNVAVRMNMPAMVWGQPGVGKSDAVRQLAAKHDAVLVDVRLSQYDSVDLRGIPVPADGLTVWHMPSTMPFVGNPRFPTDRPVFLFLDEINAAAPSVAAVAYQLILDRACGEHELMPNVRIIAAGNREGDKGVTNKMPLPLANRFCHVELGVSTDALIEHMLGQVPGECVAFLSWRKPLVSTFDPAKPAKAFATPRSWMQAFRVYEDAAMPRAVKRAAMSGLVGEGPAVEFFAFVDQLDKVIPIERILRNPDTAPIPEELSMQYATVVSVSGHMTTENVADLHTYIARYAPEFAVLCWQLAVKRDDALLGTKAFMEMARRYKDLFSVTS